MKQTDGNLSVSSQISSQSYWGKKKTSRQNTHIDEKWFCQLDLANHSVVYTVLMAHFLFEEQKNNMINSQQASQTEKHLKTQSLSASRQYLEMLSCSRKYTRANCKLSYPKLPLKQYY